MTKQPIEERIEALPLWAQKLIHAQDRRICQLRAENHQLNQCHDVLRSKSWFTIPAPKGDFMPAKGNRHLWVLYDDQPFPVCSLGENDVVLLGRDKRDFLMGMIAEEDARALASKGLDELAKEGYESLLHDRDWTWKHRNGYL